MRTHAAARLAYWSTYQRFLVDGRLARQTSQYLGEPINPHDKAAATYLAMKASLSSRRSKGLLAPHMRKLEQLNQESMSRAWADLPPMQRGDLTSLDSEGGSAGGSVVRTGGSTGEPASVLVSRDGFRRKRARSWAARRAMAWGPGMSTYCIWGAERDIGGRDRRRQRVLAGLSGMHMDGGFTTDRSRWLSLGQRMRDSEAPLALYGYSTLLHDFAMTLLAEGMCLPDGLVATVWNGAEALAPAHVESIERCVGVRPRNLYGAREVGAIAVELPGDHQSLRVLGPDVLVEVVDEDGQRVQSGELGRVLVSSFSHSGTALYRYDIGDMAVAGESFAFGHLVLNDLAGRSNEGVELSDGRVVRGLIFNHALKDYRWIRQFQVAVDRERQRVVIRVVMAFPPPPAELSAAARVLGRALPGYAVTIEESNSLPRSRQGKLRQVVDL